MLRAALISSSQCSFPVVGVYIYSLKLQVHNYRTRSRHRLNDCDPRARAIDQRSPDVPKGSLILPNNVGHDDIVETRSFLPDSGIEVHTHIYIHMYTRYNEERHIRNTLFYGPFSASMTFRDALMIETVNVSRR